jgi:hypothetical protein
METCTTSSKAAPPSQDRVADFAKRLEASLEKPLALCAAVVRESLWVICTCKLFPAAV